MSLKNLIEKLDKEFDEQFERDMAHVRTSDWLSEAEAQKEKIKSFQHKAYREIVEAIVEMIEEKKCDERFVHYFDMALARMTKSGW